MRLQRRRATFAPSVWVARGGRLGQHAGRIYSTRDWSKVFQVRPTPPPKK